MGRGDQMGELKKISKEELKEILKQHKLWFEDYEGKGEKANLSNVDISGANFKEAILSEADISGADLTGANLTDADFAGADLCEADLAWANLSGAHLSCANLKGADLTEADLTGVDLSGANLTEADLTDSDLTGADLSGANLNGAIISNTIFLNTIYTLRPYIDPDDVEDGIIHKSIAHENIAKQKSNIIKKHLLLKLDNDWNVSDLKELLECLENLYTAFCAIDFLMNLHKNNTQGTDKLTPIYSDIIYLVTSNKWQLPENYKKFKIDKIHISSPGHLFLSGVADIIEQLRELYKDVKFRNRHEEILGEITILERKLNLLNEYPEFLSNDSKALSDYLYNNAGRFRQLGIKGLLSDFYS